MDSIVKQRNDGFKEGVFINGKSELLPWPDFYVNGTYYETQKGDSNDTSIGSSIPNPYEVGGFFTVSGNSLGRYINRHNPDGSIMWTASAKSIYSYADSVSLYHFYDDGNTKWLIGMVDDTSNYIRLFKINIETGVGTYSPKVYASPSSILKIGTLEDGTLFYVILISSVPYAYLTDIETLDEGERQFQLGYLRYNSNDNYSSGISLFNGSVTLFATGFVASTGGYSYDYIIAPMAMNKSLNFTASESNKMIVRTPHCVALNSFIGSLSQLSKDIFMSPASYNNDVSANIGTYKGTRYYTRNELERWVSDCIFASTGVRIPLGEVS